MVIYDKEPREVIFDMSGLYEIGSGSRGAL